MLRRLLWMYGKHYISKQGSNIPPEEVTPVIYAHHVACELEAGNGDIDTGFCMESCREAFVLNMCIDSGSYNHTFDCLS